MNKVSIGDIANFINGYAFKPSDWNGKGKRIIRIQNLTDKNKPYNFTDTEVPSKYIVEEDDLLVSWSATLDCFIWKGEDALLNQHIFKVEEYETKVKRKYLYYALKNTIETLKNLTHGSTMKHIVKDDFESTKIPLPSLTEQEIIVQLLDNAHSIRQKRRETLRLADEFLRSTFLEMFGDPVVNSNRWETEPFSELVELDRNSVDPSNLNESKKYVGLEDIESGTGKIINYTVVNSGSLKSNKFSFTNKHLLYGKLRPYLNKVAMPSFYGICSTDIIPILPKPKKSTREFITYLMRHKAFVSFADSKSSGANLPRISPNIIEQFDTISPEYNLQQKFSEIVIGTEQLKRKYEQSLQESENLFNSLMQRAFRGEL